MSKVERRSSLVKTNSLGTKSSCIQPNSKSSDTSKIGNRNHGSLSLLLTLSSLLNSSRSRDKKDSESSLDDTNSGSLQQLDSILSRSRRNSGQSSEDVEVEIFKHVGQIKIPAVLLDEGLALLKVSQKSKKRIFVRIDPSCLTFSWQVINKNQIPNSSSLPHHGLKTLLASSLSNSKQYKFSIDDIKKLLFQLDARYYRDELNISRELEKQWMTLSYYDNNKNRIKTMHLIGDTEIDIKRFYSLINNLKRLRIELAEKFYIDLDNMDDEQRQFISNKTKNNAAKPAKEYLSFEDIIKYTARLNINVNSGYLKAIFDNLPRKLEINGIVVLDFEGFKDYIAILKKRNDIDDIWNSFCRQGGTTLNFQEVRGKIFELQGEEITPKVFQKFCTIETNTWNSESLNQFLLSKYSKPIEGKPQSPDYYDKPLNEYFISSSHNTYLIGKQIIDESSVEGYVKALQKGCRCVEIDIWDSNDANTGKIIPVVRHGRAFTSAISLRNVLTTIKKYAFVTSPLPLIISLEIKCSFESQHEVVATLYEVLGETLVSKLSNKYGILPSPSELKYRILIKAKNTSPIHTSLDISASSSTTTTTSTSFSEDTLSPMDSSSSKDSLPRRKRSTKKVIPELSRMAIYIQGLRFRNFSLPESKTFNHCFSLNEKAINVILKDEVLRKSVDKHNRSFLMRVYPGKMRLKSSNYIPIKYWLCGVQMVATNWQTFDLGQQINEAMFDGINRYGYVLKPKDIRKPLLKHTMRNLLDFEPETIAFEFTIISAHQLPKCNQTSHINPFVKVDIIGADKVSYDDKSCINKTSTIKENGFNPIWNESFTGIITGHELVFVKFTVCTTSPKDDNSVLGVFVCKLDQLKTGYRYLPLSDSLGEKLIYSSLLVKVGERQYKNRSSR